MHKKFQIRRYLVALFTGIFAVAGLIVAVDAPARAATDLGYNSTVDSSLKLTAASTQYATTAATNVIPATGSFTTEVWIKENTGVSTCADVIGQGPLGSATGRFLIRIDGTASTRQIGIFQKNDSTDTSTAIAGAYVSQNAWHHIAVAFSSGTGYSVFLDGSLIGTIANASTTNQAGAFWIGRNYHSAGCYFDGNIDEAKVWTTPRTQDQIKSDMHVYGSDNTTTFNSNLRAYYDMNEGSGSTIFNRTSNTGLNLTTSGSPAFEDVKTTSKANGKTVVTFPRTYLTPAGGWSVPTNATRAEVLIVAGGGGGGGTQAAGGGGAGAVLYSSMQTLTAGANVPVQVGQGGAGGGSTVATSNGKNGQDSKFNSVVANGGGAGGGYGYASNLSVSSGTAGGSGGGHGEYGSTIAAVASNQSAANGFTVYGNSGGAMSVNASTSGSGGGGAGGAGGAVTSNTSASGTGGAGQAFSITGTSTFYAAGGGGGSAVRTGALGGSGIGGNGGTATTGVATAGATNTGSGGGGAGYTNGGVYLSLIHISEPTRPLYISYAVFCL